MYCRNNFYVLCWFGSCLVAHRNQQQFQQNHRNSTVPTANMVNSTKQVNKVKPNITRTTTDTVVSPGYNSR